MIRVRAYAGRVRAAPSFTVGNLRCWIVPDGVAASDTDDVFFGVPRDAWHPVVGHRLDGDGMIPVPYQPLLIEADSRLILVDAGAGAEAAAEWGDPVGLTVDSLRSLGADPGDVDAVVITHGHLDHVGGLTSLVDGSRVPSFPNARHVVSQAEWDHWHATDPDPDVLRHLDTIDDAGLLDRSDGGVAVAEGIRTFETTGHTPGHVSVELASGADTALVFGDVLMGDWNFDHVDWVSSPEVDPNMAVRTRREMLERAATQHALIQAFHVDGIGEVEADGDVFRFLRRDAS